MGASDPLVFIVSGPGGVGKGTIVDALVRRDPSLWLSRSWTTRERRPGEHDTAYTWVSREEFERRIERGGFLEWTDFLGNYYGTPNPEPTEGHDTVLEIELHGARQVKSLCPAAVLIFVLPPSREEQARRLRERGDPDSKVEQRIRKADEEEPIGRAIADHVVVNDDLGQTVDEMLSIIAHHRARRSAAHGAS